MIALALDLGDRRIGIAASDPLGLTAQPISVLERKSLVEDIAHIGELARRRRAQIIIVGLPLNMDGSVGPAARRSRRFAAALRKHLALPVELWDERLTTVEAEKALLASGQRRRQRRQLRDEVAAALLLQSYLDAHRTEACPPDGRRERQ